MARTDEARLAAALRENLRRRKLRARDAAEPESTFGPDEEGDVAIPEKGDRAGAWTREGSKQD